MAIRRIIGLITLSFITSPLFSQVSVKDSSIFMTMFYATYSYQFPQGGLTALYGSNSSIGGGIMFKTKSNILIGFEGNYLFGGKVKIGDSLLKGISTPDGFVIDANGYYADIAFYERGFSFYAKFGGIIPIQEHNPNSGITLLAGVGFLQDKIRINDQNKSTPQITGDYRKGYDHLNNGLALNGSVGYSFFSNNRLLNFYLGFEFIQSWTKGHRDFSFDTEKKFDDRFSTQFYGIKAVWIIPLYKRTPKKFYYY